MFSSEKRNLREETSLKLLQIEEGSRELKVKNLLSNKFMLNRANIFLKKENNEVFMSDLELMVDLTQEILSQIYEKEQSFQKEQTQNKKSLIEKLVSHINEKILKFDKCQAFVKFCKGEKDFVIPEDFIETEPEVDYVQAAYHQFERRVEHCIEAKTFDYIYHAFQLLIVMFYDHLLADCHQKELEKESYPDLLGLLIICLVIKNKRETEENEFNFKTEAYNSLVYIINKVSQVDIVQLALQFYQAYKDDRGEELSQDHNELAVKTLTWAKRANNLINLKKSDDSGSVLVQLDFEPEVECPDVDRYMYSDYKEAAGMWKVYFSPSFNLQSIPCLPQSLKMRLSQDKLSNEHQIFYLRESAEAILEWAYNQVRDKVIPRLYDRVLPWNDYFEKYEQLIQTELLPSIEAELLYALTPKECQFQFLKLGLISNTIMQKFGASTLKEYDENQNLIDDGNESSLISQDYLQIFKKLAQNLIDTKSLHTNQQSEEFIKNKFLATKYWNLFSSCLRKSETVHYINLNKDAISLIQLDNKNKDQNIVSYLLDLLFQFNNLKYEGNTVEELKVQQSDETEEEKNQETKKIAVSLDLLANPEFQNSIWLVALEFYKKLSDIYKSNGENQEKQEQQNIKKVILEIEDIVHQYIFKDSFDLHSENVVSFQHQDVVQAIFQVFFNPIKILNEIPTHRLRDDNLLKELTKSHGESPYYEGIENLTDYNQYSKFLNMMGSATEFSINFVLNRPIRIFGYGIRSANDCPGRDPRKWSVKLKIPQDDNQIESETKYEIFNQETTWNDRYQLKDFFFEQSFLTDHVIFTFSLDYEGFDRVAASEYAGQPTIQLSEIRFHSEKVQTDEQEKLNFIKIINSTIKTLKNLKRTYSIKSISDSTNLCTLKKSQNSFTFIQLLFKKIKDHFNDQNQNFASFKETAAQLFSQEIFEIFFKSEENEEVHQLKSKVLEEYLELFFTFLLLKPDLKEKLIEEGSLEKLLQFFKEQSTPTSQTLFTIQNLINYFKDNEKALDQLKESGLLQKYLMPALEDRVSKILLLSSKIEYNQFYDLISSIKKGQLDEQTSEPNPSKILEDEKMILLKKELKKLYSIDNQMEVILDLSSEALAQIISPLRQDFLNKAKNYDLSITVIQSKGGQKFGFFVPDKWEDTQGKPELHRSFYGNYSNAKEVLNGQPFVFLFNEGQIKICEWIHHEKPIMWSGEDEFLSICMGIGIKSHRNGDYAYLDPLCWKLPNCEYKTCYVHRDKSLVFGDQGSWIFETQSIEVFGFNGVQLTSTEVETAFIAIIDFLTPKLRKLQRKFYSHLDTFIKRNFQQASVSDSRESAFPTTASFERFLYEVAEQITDSEDYVLIMKELPKIFSCINETGPLNKVLKKLFTKELDSTESCYFTKFLEIYAILCTLKPVLNKLDDQSQQPQVINQLQDVLMILINLDQSSQNPITSKKFLKFVTSQISQLKEIVVQLAKQVESYATDRVYYFEQDYQPTDQKQVREFKEVNWIDIFKKMNAYQNKIQIQHESNNITDEIDLDNFRGHLIAQINITTTMFEQFTQNPSKIGKNILQQTEILYNYLKEVKSLQISLYRTQNLSQSLFYFNQDDLASRNYISQDQIKYLKNIFRAGFIQEQEDYIQNNSDFSQNIKSLVTDLLFFQDNQKVINSQIDALQKQLLTQAEQDNKNVDYIRQDKIFFQFQDFDKFDLFNQISKIKEKKINSPDYQVFMKNVALILETFENSITNAFDDNIKLIEFVQDDHMKNFLQIFTFIKKLDLQLGEEILPSTPQYKCKKDHTLIFYEKDPYSYHGSALCDECRTSSIISMGYLYHCLDCNYDICKNCSQNYSKYGKKIKITAQCTRSHTLELHTKDPYESLPVEQEPQCNKCETSIIRSKGYSLHCPKCYYDLCKKCYIAQSENKIHETTEEELNSCISQEAYKSYLEILKQFEDGINKLLNISESQINKDILIKHSIYNNKQEFFCNYFYNLIAGVFYQDGLKQIKTKEEKENSLIWLNQILLSEIQQLDRNLNENVIIFNIQKSVLTKISNSFSQFSHLKLVETNDESNAGEFSQEFNPAENKKSPLDENLISQITEMGFERKYARKVLRLKGDLESAINFLLEENVSKLDDVSDDEEDKQSEEQTQEVKDLTKEKCKELLQKIISEKLMKSVKEKEKEQRRESLISIQEFYKFFDKTQVFYYLFTQKWYLESTESESKTKFKVLFDDYLKNCLEYNIFPKSYGLRSIFSQIYDKNFNLFVSKVSQIQDFTLFGGDNQDIQKQIILFNEISQQFQIMFNLINNDQLRNYFQIIKNEEDINFQAFQNQVFKLLELLISGKQNTQPKEFLKIQVQLLMDNEEKHKSLFLNKSLSLIFRCLQMYRIFQQKYVLKFEKVQDKYKDLVDKPKDDQKDLQESKYKAKSYNYFSKIQLLNNKGLCEKVHSYSLACRSQINQLNLSTESFDECKFLLLQLNDASLFVQSITDHILSDLKQSSLLQNQNILIMPSKFSQNISLDLETEESGPTSQQTRSIGTLQIVRMLSLINNNRLAEQFAFLIKKSLTLRAKKQAMYNQQQSNLPVQNMKEILITQQDSKVDILKFINDFRKNYLCVEKDDYYAYKSQPISDESAKFFTETMYQAIPLVCQVQIPTNKFEGNVDNSFVMLKKEIVDQINNKNESDVELENQKEIKLYENLMGQMVESGSFMLKKIEKSWTEDIQKFEDIYNWSQMTILALRTLSQIARTSFDCKSSLMTRIENDLKENSKLSLLTWFKNVYLPIRLLGTHTFKVSSSVDPDNTETTEASVFMIADYNENLDKNICFFLNELLGYGHAYSESAVVQRKTLRQKLLISCLETLQDNFEKTSQNQVLGNGYFSMSVLEQSQQLGSIMIIQYLVNQYNFFDYNRSVQSRTCYQETIDTLFEWQSTNKTDSVHLIYGLQEQVQWLTQLPYVKEETSLPGKQNKSELLKKLKYITTQGFASQILDRITLIFSNLTFYQQQLSDRQKKLQASNQKIDMDQVKEQKIEIQGPEEQTEQIIQQINDNQTEIQQQPAEKIDQRSEQNIPAQQSSETNQNNTIDNNQQHNEDENAIYYEKRDLGNIESEHAKAYSSYDENDEMDGTNNLAKSIYPKYNIQNIDLGSLNVVTYNQCHKIEYDIMHFHVSWPYNEQSRSLLNYQDIKNKQVEINSEGNANLCPLIQILKPLTTQNFYDLGQIIEDRFFQVLAKIEIRERSLQDNPEKEEDEVKNRRDYRSYGNDQNDTKYYFERFIEYQRYINDDYYRKEYVTSYYNSCLNYIKYQGITGLGFRNLFDPKKWKPNSSDPINENVNLDESFSSENEYKPPVTYDNNDKIKQFIQNLFDKGQLSFETIEKEPEPEAEQQDQIAEQKEEDVSSEVQSTPDINVQESLVFNLKKSSEQTTDQIIQEESNQISNLEQIDSQTIIPVARINGLIYIQAEQLGIASYYFQEPGLVEPLQNNLESQNEFPKEILQDQEFPEFASLSKRQSGSYISYSTAPDDWRLDNGERFPEKKYFLETHYDSEKRIFLGWIDWTEEPIYEQGTFWQYQIEFSEDFQRIQSGYCVTRDRNGKVKSTDKFQEQLFFSLYKEPEPDPPKEPEDLDLGQLITSVRDIQLRRELLLELSKEEVAQLPQELKDELQRILDSQNNAEQTQVTQVIQQNLEDPASKDLDRLLVENLADLDQLNEDYAILTKEGQNILEKVNRINSDQKGENFIKNLLQNMIFQEFRNYSKQVFDNFNKQKFNPKQPLTSDLKFKMMNQIIILIKIVQEKNVEKLSQYFQLSLQLQEALQSKIKTQFLTKTFVKLTIIFTEIVKEDGVLAKEIFKSFIAPENEQSDGESSLFQNLLQILSQNLDKQREEEKKVEPDRNEEFLNSYKTISASVRILFRHLLNQLSSDDKVQNLEVGLKDTTLQKKAKELQEKHNYKLLSSHELFSQAKFDSLVNLMNQPNLNDKKISISLSSVLCKTTQLNLIDLYLFDSVKQINSIDVIEDQDFKIDLNIPSDRQEIFNIFKQASNQTAYKCFKNFTSIISGQTANLKESLTQLIDLAFNINEIVGCKDIPTLKSFSSVKLEKTLSIKDIMQQQIKIMVDVKKIEITKEFTSEEGQDLRDQIDKFKIQSAQLVHILSGSNQTIRQLAQTKSKYEKAKSHFIQKIEEKLKKRQDDEEDQKVLGFLNLAIELTVKQINSAHALFISDEFEDFINLASQFLLSTQKMTSERGTLDDYAKQLYIIVFEYFQPEMILEVISIKSKEGQDGKEQVNMQKLEKQQPEETQTQSNIQDSLSLLRRTSNFKKPDKKFDLLFKDEISAPSERLQLFNTFCTQNKYLLNEYLKQNIEYSGNHSELVDVFNTMKQMPKLLSFESKKTLFDKEIEALRTYGDFYPEISRADLFETAFQKFYFATPEQLRYTYFKIYFEGEPGIDAGGVRRDFFNQISKSIFNEDFGFFSHSDNGSTYMPNPQSVVQLDYDKYFRFIGRIIAKAIMEKCMLECYFTPSVYKMILGQTLTFKDLQEIDNHLYQGLLWCLQPNSDVELLYETFSIDQDYFGKQKTIDIIPGGSEIDLTNENKDLYVESKAFYVLYIQIKSQMDAFLQGFYDVIPRDSINIFSYKELELIISGQPHVDIADLKANTDYSYYDSNSQQVIWFWEVMESLNEFDKASFLQFVTGCSKVPAGGFEKLFGMGSLRKFCISKDWSNPELNLPQAHTCYNQLDLPEYKTKETLQEKLMWAIREAGGFGFG